MMHKKYGLPNCNIKDHRGKFQLSQKIEVSETSFPNEVIQ